MRERAVTSVRARRLVPERIARHRLPDLVADGVLRQVLASIGGTARGFVPDGVARHWLPDLVADVELRQELAGGGGSAGRLVIDVAARFVAARPGPEDMNRS